MISLIECRACGKQISPNAESCPNCGEPNQRSQVQLGNERHEKPKQTATGCLAALLIGLIIGGILYFMIVGLR